MAGATSSVKEGSSFGSIGPAYEKGPEYEQDDVLPHEDRDLRQSADRREEVGGAMPRQLLHESREDVPGHQHGPRAALDAPDAAQERHQRDQGRDDEQFRVAPLARVRQPDGPPPAVPDGDGAGDDHGEDQDGDGGDERAGGPIGVLEHESGDESAEADNQPLADEDEQGEYLRRTGTADAGKGVG